MAQRSTRRVRANAPRSAPRQDECQRQLQLRRMKLSQAQRDAKAHRVRMKRTGGVPFSVAELFLDIFSGLLVLEERAAKKKVLLNVQKPKRGQDTSSRVFCLKACIISLPPANWFQGWLFVGEMASSQIIPCPQSTPTIPVSPAKVLFPFQL